MYCFIGSTACPNIMSDGLAADWTLLTLFTSFSSFNGENGGSEPESGGESGRWWRGSWPLFCGCGGPLTRGWPLYPIWVTVNAVVTGRWTVTVWRRFGWVGCGLEWTGNGCDCDKLCCCCGCALVWVFGDLLLLFTASVTVVVVVRGAGVGPGTDCWPANCCCSEAAGGPAVVGCCVGTGGWPEFTLIALRGDSSSLRSLLTKASWKYLKWARSAFNCG